MLWAISEPPCIPFCILRGLDPPLWPHDPEGQGGNLDTSPCGSGAKGNKYLKAVLQDNPAFPHNQAPCLPAHTELGKGSRQLPHPHTQPLTRTAEPLAP